MTELVDSFYYFSWYLTKKAVRLNDNKIGYYTEDLLIETKVYKTNEAAAFEYEIALESYYEDNFEYFIELFKAS